jgi:signal transduction histidine kinase
MKGKYHERIAIRLSLAIVVVVLVTAITVASLVLHDEKNILQHDLRVRGMQLGEIMARQALEPLLYEENFTLHELLSSYLAASDALLVYGELYDEKGEEILVRERKAMHRKAINFNEYAGNKATFLVDVGQEGGSTPLDLVVPVSSPKIGVVGYLRLGVSVKPLLATIETSRRKVWVVTTIIAVLGSLAGLWMARGLIAPVLLLNQAVHEVGKGSLGTEIPEAGIGEIRELGIAFNIMSRRLKELVDEITAAQENLVRTEKLYALGEFSTGLAHEIKNPLTSMKMLIQRAENENEPLEGEDLSVILGELERIDDTVSRFLRSARQSEIRVSDTDINAVIEDVIAITRPKIEKSGVVIVQELTQGLAPLRIDASGIKQILMNGILNALQAMAGGGRLSISTNVEGDEFRCILSDTGSGIGEKDIKYIFDPFFTTKEEGTGMGLAVAWNIARQHGGRLDIYSNTSTTNRGTSFILVLPYGNASYS